MWVNGFKVFLGILFVHPSNWVTLGSGAGDWGGHVKNYVYMCRIILAIKRFYVNPEGISNRFVLFLVQMGSCWSGGESNDISTIWYKKTTRSSQLYFGSLYSSFIHNASPTGSSSNTKKHCRRLTHKVICVYIAPLLIFWFESICCFNKALTQALVNKWSFRSSIVSMTHKGVLNVQME